MSTLDLTTIGGTLARRQREIVAAIRNHLRIEGTSLHAMSNQHDFTDDDSVADYFAEQEIATLTHEIGELRDIQAAQARLAAGQFGICVDCGEDVGAARLAAYLTAKRCIACQQKHEAHRRFPSM